MKRLCLGCAMLFLALVAVIAYLWFAGPQANRWAYRFHANYLYYTRQSSDKNVLSPPNDFTGVWKVWYEDGRRNECQYVDGKRHGKLCNWDANGQLLRETFWREYDYRERHWIDGKEVSDGVFRRAEPWYGSFWIRERNPDTTDGAMDYYLDGQKVTAEAYGKWVKETGGISELLKRHPEIKR
ncbi:MAG: hypothetical protein J6333_03755 [Planctomycetes bacterium]|nr:hypothetical protein [Planctomycetota bacterium]